MKQLRSGLVFEAKRYAVAELAARIQPRIEQMPRHHITKRLEHRLLDAGVLLLEVEDQALDALALQEPMIGSSRAFAYCRASASST